MLGVTKRALAARHLALFLVSFLLALVTVQTLALKPAFAQSLASAPMIFDVRRSLPLEADEQVYHDFYINAGPEAGFRKGMYVTVVRLVPVHDPVQNKQQATLTVNVAKLQVIHVERGITVARLQYEFNDEERPTLEYESVMIGDHIDPATMTMEAPGTKKKAKPVKAAKNDVAVLPSASIAVAPAATSLASVGSVASSAAAPPAPPVAVPSGNKSASPDSPSPDMVRVPVPGSGTQKL